MAHDVFVSHSAKDKPTADAVCAMLEAQGIRCWVAPRDIVPGKDWGESIVDAIKGARVMVLIFSSHANDSHQIKREVERAVNKGIPVIPLRIEAIEPTASLEYFLSTPHWLDAFTPPLEKHLQYLAQVIRSIIGGTPAEPTLVPPTAKNRPEVVDAIKTEAPGKTPTDISPGAGSGNKKRKFPMLAMAIVSLILACLGAWYFGVYQPEQKHQAEARRQAADTAAKELAAKQAADAKAQADAEAARQAEAKRQAAQRTAEELAATKAADAKTQADAEIARQAEARRQAAQKAAEELAAKQAADAKAQADAETARKAEARREADAEAARQAEAQRKADALAAQQAVALKKTNDIQKISSVIGDLKPAVLTITNTETRPKSSPAAALNKLSLLDFNEIFGLKIGAKTDGVRGLFGDPNAEYSMGGSFHDQYLVWTYRAGGTEDLKIVFDNQSKVIRSITFDEDHLPWLAARSVSDPKLSLLGKSNIDIEKLIGHPTQIYTSTVWYQGKGLDVEFLCAEHNRFKCSRIVINWDGQ